ncbi:MAG: hypothetical protein MUC51_19660 [Anaerolineae bacterium]|nr:hypothetical protein [Anaerolineae bacterium]
MIGGDTAARCHSSPKARSALRASDPHHRAVRVAHDVTQLRSAARADQEHHVGGRRPVLGDQLLDHLGIEQPVAGHHQHRALVAQRREDGRALLRCVPGAELLGLVDVHRAGVVPADRLDDLPCQRAHDEDVLIDAAALVGVDGSHDSGPAVDVKTDFVPVGRVHACALAAREDDADDGVQPANLSSDGFA